MKQIMLLLFVLFIPGTANALEICGVMPVGNIVVQADRENGTPWANTTRFDLSGSGCSGIAYAYLFNDHPTQKSILAVLLTAQATNRNVVVVVKSSERISSTAREIEFITLD